MMPGISAAGRARGRGRRSCPQGTPERCSLTPPLKQVLQMELIRIRKPGQRGEQGPGTSAGGRGNKDLEVLKSVPFRCDVCVDDPDYYMGLQEGGKSAF